MGPLATNAASDMARYFGALVTDFQCIRQDFCLKFADITIEALGAICNNQASRGLDQLHSIPAAFVKDEHIARMEMLNSWECRNVAREREESIYAVLDFGFH